MSKKMWQKIFKSKAQKPQPLAKINKRHSRVVYEEYQQLGDLLAAESGQLCFGSEKENEMENACGNGSASGNSSCSINIFEQPPLQSSFNSLELSEAHQLQQPRQQQLSTFSRVRNTFSLRRNSRKLGTAKPSESDEAAPATEDATAAALTNNGPGHRRQRVVIVVNKIDVATNSPSNHLHANPPAHTTETAINSTTSSTTDPEAEVPMRGAEDDPLPPPPLTSGSSLPVPEYVPEQAKQLTPCPCCSRTFVVDALRKHVVICEKSSKKRKIFDSSRQRRDGTALSTYVLPKNFGLPNAERTAGLPSPPTTSREAMTTSVNAGPPEPVNSPQPVRRKSQTEMVRSTARASLRKAASTLSSNSATEAPAGPPAAAAAPLVRERSLARRIKAPACDRCPHCERTFNPKAFDRHVEWCKEKAIQNTIKSTNSQETSKAKERLEARKQYKPPNLKTKRSLARDKYSGNHEELLEAGEIAAPKPGMMSLSMTSSVHSDNGLGDKYDPFLSAKRQLEELCSPSTPPPEEEVTTTTTTTTSTVRTPKTPTPSIAMTTSLTTTTTKPAQIAQKTTPASSFRRTSSLRGPRRTPMLNSRPLFATNYRPTIQRGLSDEGPISTNFLKPEEFDEMPVRAACGNDFHSPRVVRRDTSASNRKQLLKLPVGSGTNEAPSQAGRSVAKTDSLAVFLKYEHELEQLNAKAAELAAANQLTSKEQKDKSNTLSKQNSAKSLGQSTPTQLPPLTPTTVPKSPSGVIKEVVNYPPVATPLRLEPISSKPVTSMNPPAPLTPIKLESIFGPRRETALGSGGSATASLPGDYIDPKLINACDNLHVNSGISSDASSTPQQLSQSRSRSSSQSTITHERRQSGEARNLLKRKMRLGRNQFLYDASPEDADASSGCSADDEANRSSMEYDEQCWQQQQKQLLANPLPLVMPMVHNALPTFDDFDFEEFLSSFENENEDEQFPLFKDCREFLMNRSTSRQRSFQKATSTPQTTVTATQLNAQPHGLQSKIKDNHHAHRSPQDPRMPDERLQRRQSNASSASSQEEKQSRLELEKRTADEEHQQKREIFISIETEANAQGRSPISPESLRHMVGNAQTPIDVLHIENGNEPEHARFRKISDTEDAGDEPGDRSSQATNRLAPSSSGSAVAPNVQLNNAKNLIQQMQSDFRQIGENASASMRRMLIVGNDGGRGGEELRDGNSGGPIQGHAQQQHHQVKANSPLTPSPSADSDELSSLDGYPMSSSHGSRRGASSKLSSDSAYGSSNSPYSLSRQRSTELQTGSPRGQGLLRPHTASAKLSGMMDASTQAQTDYGTLKARQRLFAPDFGNNNGEGSESCSSGSDHSFAAQPNLQQQQQQQQQQQETSNYNYQQQQLQQETSNYNYQQQQQQQEAAQSPPAYNNNNNNSVPMTPTTSEHSLMSNSSTSTSKKMSNFCHECGSKFIIESAKYCMDCGIKRVAL
ncbi:serine-rich adhesin for platelets isoform X1 [Drosophila biarmipes]|uniref:serine-rich adhesin for platelets isoform X1 n=1 Tax=Drosophila biarmipes TaxID=125945 RepID=UPI0007E6298F|nr:serine-rich adhesin for platelets isoform X1 [Drosophila biarmipes]